MLYFSESSQKMRFNDVWVDIAAMYPVSDAVNGKIPPLWPQSSRGGRSRTGWGHVHGPPHAILFRKLSESSFQRCMGLGVEDVPADREIPGDRPRSTEIHPDFGRYRQVAGDSIAYFLIAQRVDLTT